MRTTWFVFLVIVLLSCKLKGKEKLEPVKYDTSVIAILKWDTAKYYSFPKNSDSTILTQNDLNLIDSLFKDAVENYNNNQRPRLSGWYKVFGREDSNLVLINIKRYKRQYLPYKDLNGEKIVYVNCFCTNFGVFPLWKEVEETVDDGGNCYFQLKINLTQNKWFDFSVNGYG